MNILAVVAHPDDEVLGCGGTLIRHSRRRDSVYVCILGQGVESRNFTELRKIRELANILKSAKEASLVLGVKKTFQYKYPNNRLDSVHLLDVTKTVEGVIEAVKPEIVYTHYRDDLNIDHQVTYRAVMTACRPIGTNRKINICCFEVPSSTGWQRRPFNPNLFVDITRYMNLKIEALLKYKSEIRKPPHPRSTEGIKNLAIYRGTQAGMKYAEGFEIIRCVSDFKPVK